MTPAARLTWRFALLPALAVVALTVVMLAAGYRLLGQELTGRALASNQQRADLLALQLQLSLRDAVSQVQLLARSPLLRPGAPPERLRAELDHLVERSPRFVWAGLVRPDGRVLAGSRGWLEGQSIAGRPVFARGREGMVGDVHEAIALAPLLARLPGGAGELIDIGEPVLDEAGQVVAIVTAHLGLQWVREQVALSLGTPDAAAAAGLQALVLTQTGTHSVVPGASVPAGLPAEAGLARTWQGPDGRPWLRAQSALHGAPGSAPLLPWRVTVLQSVDAALVPLRQLTRSMLWTGIVAALMLGGAGFWASRRMLTPWDPLFDAVLAGQNGDGARVAERVQTLIAERADRAPPTPTERLIGWLARDAGNLRRALDHLPVAIGLADRHHRYEYVNPAFTRLLGWTTQAVYGRLMGEPLLEPAEREVWAKLLLQLEAEPGEFVSRLEALTATGKRVAVQRHLVPMLDAQGRQVGVVSVLHDIRAERSARVRADAMAGRLRALADAAVDTLLATLDIDGRVLEWSRGAEQLTGHAPAAALGRALGELLPNAGEVTACLRQAQIGGHCHLVVQAGERRFEGSLYRLALAPGAARFGLILRDVSDRAARQRLVETARDELTQLNRRLLEQEKQTSRKLAQSLHDELGQTLAALRLHWEACRGAGPEQRERMDERIAALVVLANRQVRGVLAELRPPLLDELGLAAAIDNELRQHQGSDTEPRASLEASDTAQRQRWPADVEYAAFMITREALLNALRHAGAHVIRLRLDGDERLLVLTVEDDGCGMPQLQEGGRPGHLGLVGMRERALAIGARLQIDGRPGHGTMVELTWTPAEDAARDEPHLPD